MHPLRTLATLLLLAPATPASDALQSLTIDTGRPKATAFVLAGRDSWQQLTATGTYPGAQRDLTRQASWSTEPAGVVSVDAAGLVTPVKEGQATVTAKVAGQVASVKVTVRQIEQDVPVHFANEVVPIFTKFGCNAGGCHGKASGQNGFKLSLLGFEPEEDYEYLVKEGRGRRLFPAAPEQSLLLRKASGAMAHGGGRKLPAESPFYRVLLRWVAQGAPYGKADDPTVKSIEVFPAERVLTRGASQQLIVLAHMSDGSTRDVTRMAQFESNAPELAEASETGLVTVKQLPGRAAVMARFQSHVGVFRATVPLGAKVEKLPPVKSFIDTLVQKQWKQLGLPPSERCGDSTFVRRATIDLAGRLPTPKEVEEFVESREADKDEKLIDRLLASEDHADYFANKWSALLRNRRGTAEDTAATFAFHAWIRQGILDNKPHDQFAREVLTATGEEGKTPPAVWYRELKEPANLVEDAAQLFLGQRIGCAKCHHHPLEKWSQEDYWGMVAFFSRVKVTLPTPPRRGRGKNAKPQPGKPGAVAFQPGEAQATNPRTGKPVKPTGLGGKPITVARDEDPRVKLAEWMTAADNPFFARTLANRTWKHFLGRGLVEPEDDLRVTNPPSNPELLDALAKHLVESKYDVRKLIRAICTSSVYRLSAVPNRHNAGDRQSYSRFLPRRLHAEVLLDAIDAVTGSKSTFKGARPGTRAVQLPDNLFDSYFLSVFGRPDAASACECERSSESSLAQSLHMLNSAEILGKVSGTRAKDLARDKRPHADRLRDLYLLALSRPPSKEELAVLVEHVEKNKKGAQAGYEDVVWALINTKEFTFNH